MIRTDWGRREEKERDEGEQREGREVKKLDCATSD